LQTSLAKPDSGKVLAIFATLEWIVSRLSEGLVWASSLMTENHRAFIQRRTSPLIERIEQIHTDA
jgi:hypothetical protein